MDTGGETVMDLVARILSILGLYWPDFFPEGHFSLKALLFSVINELEHLNTSLKELETENRLQRQNIQALQEKLAAAEQSQQVHIKPYRLIQIFMEIFKYMERWGLTRSQLIDVVVLIAEGRKIEAIKLLRQAKNINLKEAVDLVDEIKNDDVPF